MSPLAGFQPACERCGWTTDPLPTHALAFEAATEHDSWCPANNELPPSFFQQKQAEAMRARVQKQKMDARRAAARNKGYTIIR